MELKILLLDDEEPALKNLAYATSRAVPNSELYCTQDPLDALEHIRNHEVDVIMADIEMPGMNGITFAQAVGEIRSNINIIFVTAYSEYALEAIGNRASGYLLKPVRIDDIRREIEHLRYPVTREEDDERLKAVCFGRFEVYYKREHVHFSRIAEKEILAYLIDLKGGGANTNELCGILWEDSEERARRRDYLRVIYHGLRKTLEKYNCGDVLIKQQNYFAVDPSRIKCDYYDFLKGDREAINAWNGEYMSQYSWANMTAGELEERKMELDE